MGAEPENGNKRIVVVSDVHLGTDKCDRPAFDSFLDWLRDEPEITDLVLLGDIVDMWRRDASGVFLESRETMGRLLSLQPRIKLHYVAGNHDHHVQHLKNAKEYFRYPFEFAPELTLTDGPFTYRFIHGHELEYGTRDEDPLMYMVIEALCHVMSDGEGHFEDEVWGLVTRTWSEITYFISAITLRKKRQIKLAARRLQSDPETRLKETRKEIDRRALRKQGGRSNEVLVFGHTHHPFIDEQENIVNSGSWVTSSPVHNTYVVLSGGKPRLFVFGQGELTEREGVAKD